MESTDQLYQLTKPKSNRISPAFPICPLCGATLNLQSSRDWHALGLCSVIKVNFGGAS